MVLGSVNRLATIRIPDPALFYCLGGGKYEKSRDPERNLYFFSFKDEFQFRELNTTDCLEFCFVDKIYYNIPDIRS